MSERAVTAPPERARPLPVTAASSRGALGSAALVAAGAAGYLAVLGVHLRGILDSIYTNSDALISPLVATALNADRHGRTVWMASDTFMNAVWFDRLVGSSPAARVVEQWTPAVLCLAAVVVLGWSARRVLGGGGPWWLAPAAALALPPAALYGLLPQDFHGSTTLAAVLVAGLLAGAATGMRMQGPVAVVTGALAGLCLASDPLLVVVGAAPLWIAVLAALRRGPSRAARAAARAAMVATAAAAVAVAVTAVATRKEGVTLLPAEGGGGLASLDRAWRNARLLAGQVARLADGRLFGGAVGGVEGALAAVAGAAALGAVVMLALRHAGTSPGPAAGPAPAVPDVESEQATARLMLGIYWSSSAVLLGAAYVLSTFATDTATVRYLSVLPWAVAALLPLAVAASPRRVAVAAVLTAAWSAASAVGVASVATGVYAWGGAGTRPRAMLADLGAVATALQARGLTRGYADYWDAGALTWATGDRVQVRPVMEGRPCGDPGGGTVCAYHWNTADRWFDPQPVARTFVVTHPGASCLDGPEPRLGDPVERFSAGEAEVLVYAGDVAARFAQSRFALCPPS